MKVKSNKLFKNISISVCVQIISLVTSFVLNLIVPKFISEINYANWQSYVLYSTYVSILQFGLIDGLILKYSQYDYNELNKDEIRPQLQLFMSFLTVVAIMGIAVALFFFNGYLRTLLILLSVAVIVKNYFWNNGSILQITYRFKEYAILIISQKVVYLAVVFLLLCLGVDNFVWYCLADVFGDVFCILFGYKYNKELLFGRPGKIKDALANIWDNVKVGILLIVANLSSSLIVGVAKMIVDWRWGKEVFGKVAFSFSLSSLFLTFITAVSVVLFPALKRTENDKLAVMYQKIRNVITPFLIFVFLFYFPIVKVVEVWLPNYSISCKYLGILLPMVLFASRVGLLTNNYFKVLRKEKSMFVVNVLSVFGAGVLYVIFAYFLDDITWFLISVTVIEAIKYLISEIMIVKDLKLTFVLDSVLEFCGVAIFLLSNIVFKGYESLLIYLSYVAIYFILKLSLKNKRKKDNRGEL